MTFFQTIVEILRGWTDSVAAAIIAGFDRIASPRVVRLVEQDDGAFAIGDAAKPDAVGRAGFVDGALQAPGVDLGPLLRGNRVEVVLQARRFLFRPLELPARAADFLEGIVRAQIDRLTPWSATEAVFGCSAPTASGNESITTTVAATTRKTAMSYVQALLAFHPNAVAVCTDIVGQGGRVKVFEQKARGHLDANRLSGMLLTALAVVAIGTLLSAIAATYMVDRLSSQEYELARQISQRRAAILSSSAQGDRSPIIALERRKHEAPASVIVLDALTKALPDNTYLTEFHLAGSKLQIVGITRDAPALIPLIEQSTHFTRATFYAPTTRATTDPGERFHIEALVRPKNTLTP